MHAVTYGVSRDQMMARHKANHIQVAYANSAEGGRRRAAGQGRDGRRHGHGRVPLRHAEEREEVVGGPRGSLGVSYALRQLKGFIENSLSHGTQGCTIASSRALDNAAAQPSCLGKPVLHGLRHSSCLEDRFHLGYEATGLVEHFGDLLASEFRDVRIVRVGPAVKSPLKRLAKLGGKPANLDVLAMKP